MILRPDSQMCEEMMILKQSPGDVIVLPGKLLIVVLNLQSNWAAHTVHWEMETIRAQSFTLMSWKQSKG